MDFMMEFLVIQAQGSWLSNLINRTSRKFDNFWNIHTLISPAIVWVNVAPRL